MSVLPSLFDISADFGALLPALIPFAVLYFTLTRHKDRGQMSRSLYPHALLLLSLMQLLTAAAGTGIQPAAADAVSVCASSAENWYPVNSSGELKDAMDAGKRDCYLYMPYIRLTDNITVDFTFDYNAVIDLNGNTLGCGLVINSGANIKIEDNTETPDTPGKGRIYTKDFIGSCVEVSGTLTLEKRSISGGHADKGGGVHVKYGGKFYMNGGEISDNEAGEGGGVYIDSGGTFSLTDGTVTRNTAKSDNNGSGNSATGNGGGVYNLGNFSISGSGTVTANTARRCVSRRQFFHPHGCSPGHRQ